MTTGETTIVHPQEGETTTTIIPMNPTRTVHQVGGPGVKEAMVEDMKVGKDNTEETTDTMNADESKTNVGNFNREAKVGNNGIGLRSSTVVLWG